MQSGTVNVSGATTVARALFRIDGGNVTGDATTVGTLKSFNGGVWTWTGGNMDGTLRIDTGTAFNVSGSILKSLSSGTVLNNYGVVNQSGIIYANGYYGAATINNRNGGVWSFAGGGLTRDNGASNFNNEGIATVGAPLGVSSLNWNFAQAATGRLNLDLGGTNAATRNLTSYPSVAL